MKSQLEKKLNKLPQSIEHGNIEYFLCIDKIQSYNLTDWEVRYIDPITETSLIETIHKNLEAAVDNMFYAFKEVNNINNNINPATI